MPEYKFIPREKIDAIRPKDSYAGVINVLVFLIFLGSLLVYGAAFFYQWYLNREIKDYNSTFEKIKPDIEINSVVDIIRKSQEIDLAKKIINKHEASSHIFPALEKDALKNNYFTSFSFGGTDGSSDKKQSASNLKVSMNGVSKSFEDLAKQMDTFNSSENMTDVNFSNFELLENGDVSYDVSFNIKGSVLKY